MSIDIAAGLVPSGAGVPSVCSRHGEPAVLHKPVKFISKPPGWTYALLLAGFVPYLIAVTALRREVRATSWPFCARCQQMHKRRALLGAALFLPLILIILLVTVAPETDGPAMVPVAFAAFAGCFGGIVALARGSYRMLPQGFVSRDGNWVGFAKAHPAFAAEGRARYEYALQQHTAAQASHYAAAQASHYAAYGQQQPQA